MHYKVKEHDELVKDSKSGAILLVDKSVADEYKARKAVMKTSRELATEINMIKNEMEDISVIKAELDEIKKLLREIVSRN
jgi:uncharacterized protein YydD (DUF2326 family)